ncbi:MAG: hypothetical protein K1060chlam2_01065, partial [Chlamydiae bacterium]|nr:hypothetical protein [Chlamydiota bacterium]
ALQLQEQLSLQEKCKKIATFIDQVDPDDKGDFLSDLSIRVAPFDSNLALEYASQIEEPIWRFICGLELSKYQSDEEARQTLLNLRETCPELISDPMLQIILIEEELRRGFFQERGVKELPATEAYIYGKLGKIDEAVRALEKVFANYQASREVPEAYKYEREDKLRAMLYVAATYQLPQIDKILQAYRDSTDEASKRNTPFLVGLKLIEVETKFSHLHGHLDQEVKNVIEILHTRDDAYANPDLMLIFGTLLPVRPDLAIELLKAIPQDSERVVNWQINPTVRYFECFPDRESLNAFIVEAEERRNPDLFLVLFRAIEKEEGIESALPYLNRAKELATHRWEHFRIIETEIEYNLPYIKRVVEDKSTIIDILEFEMKNNLPSSKETLNRIYQMMEEENSYNLYAFIDAFILGEFPNFYSGPGSPLVKKVEVSNRNPRWVSYKSIEVNHFGLGV